ncbi:MAG: ABC transporter ATP-binding protein [Sulfuritalea sp.]|nr:ABC transporter ATP-binding protein [Sulfuritalea sp.]
MSEVILETRSLSKEFKGFTAVSNVNLKVSKGSIHALIGPNGAGKTTFFNLVTKFLPPSAGTIHFKGEDITHEAAAASARRGFVRSFQISATFPHLTALENVRIGLQQKLGTQFHFWKSERSLNHLNAEAMQLLDEVGLASFANTVVAEMPYGRKRALELATTLALNPELVLLDEPTQGMGQEDIARVVNLIRKISANRTILMVEHNLSVVANLCDRITVLTRGSVLAEGTYEEISKNPQVLEAYVGSNDMADAHH